MHSETLVEERVNILLERLSEREALMVKKRNGLDDLYIKTLEAIGKEFGLTRERVRQVVAKAIVKILEPYEDTWNKHYEALLDWGKEHPDESVPQKLIHNGLNIGSWANTIRGAARPEYKGDRRVLTDEQRKKLNDAGFIWDPRKDTNINIT